MKGRGIVGLPWPLGNSALAYLAATAISAAAVLLRLALDPHLSAVPFITFFPAVVLASHLCGQRPGVLAALLCGVAGWYLLVPPTYSFRIERPADAITLGVYFLTAIAIALLVGRSRAAVEREKSAKQVLSASESRLRAVFEQAAAGFARTDLSGRFTEVNDRYCEIVGRRREELLSLCMQDLTHPDDLKPNLSPFEALAVGGPAFDIEKRYLRPDGSTVWVRNSVSAIRSADGKVEGTLAVSIDLTQKRLAEARQRESEARFRGVFNSRLMGFTIFDAHTGETLSINDTFLEMTGHTRADYEEGRWDWRDFTVSEYLALDEAATAQARERGWWDTYEKVYVRRDGTRFPVRLSSAPMPGEPGRVVVGIEDVTAERAAEAALRDSEARYRTLFESIESGFCVVEVAFDAGGRADYRVMEANPAFYRQTGFPESIFGRWLREASPDLEEHWYDTYGRVARTGEPVRFEQGSDALGRWFDVYAFRVGEPEDKRVAILFNDISARRDAEERLRNLNETLEQQVAERTAERDRIWQLSPDLMCVAKTDGTLLSVNPAWQRTLGWSAAWLTGRNAAEIKHPEDAERTAAELGRLAAGHRTVNFEDRYRHSDGGWRWISWVIEPEGELIYCIGRDVTAEKQRQSELEAAQEALRQSQKLESMGQLTGGVAHDVNNLLTPIMGSLDLLSRRGVGGEREQRMINGALQSAERAKVLVQRLLAFARRQPLQPVPVDVGALVAGMADLVMSTSGPRVHLELDLAPGLPPARADANQLEMALLNLAVNSRDAMPDGGRLTISAKPETVGGEHRARLRPGDYVHLSVADTGAGMDEATLARCIEPFYSTKGVGKGTGLGLSMVHGLAAQLGGAMAIGSKPRLGTNVELWLPVSCEAVQTQDRTADNGAPATGVALLVDDEELVRTSTADMLADLGYAVVEAGSAEEALKLIDNDLRFDLLVTDHLMAGMTGTELAREVRARRPEAPVLVVSGYTEVDGIAPDLPRLTKPYKRDDLAAAVAELTSA